MAAALPINNFSIVPSEVLPSVFTFLSMEEFFSAYKTCKAFRDVIATNHLAWQGRVAIALASPRPNDVSEDQHATNLRLLKQVRDKAAAGVSERDILCRGILEIKAEKAAKFIQQALIASVVVKSSLLL